LEVESKEMDINHADNWRILEDIEQLKEEEKELIWEYFPQEGEDSIMKDVDQNSDEGIGRQIEKNESKIKDRNWSNLMAKF
jgi:hypothetical protein